MAMAGIPRLLRRLPSDVLRLRLRRTAPGKPPTGYVDVYADAAGALAGVDDTGGALSIGGGGGTDYLCYADEKASGAGGGTFTQGAWRTRDLTVERADTGGHGSLAGNQITLAAGTYRVYARAPGYACRGHQARLYDTTGSAELVLGSSVYADDGNGGLENAGYVQNDSIVQGRFTLSVSSVIELQHQCIATSAGTGFGGNANIVTEVYAVVELWREL
jgi:hypothetical protein